MGAQRRYVLGFLFCAPKGSSVILIRKNRPEWQAGKLNGVGGKIEPAETGPEAMAREFFEETGLAIPCDDWQHMLTMRFADEVARDLKGDAEVQVFRSLWRGEGAIPPVKSMTDEAVGVFPAASAWAFDVVPNLRWLVPMCRYADTAKPFDMEMAS